MDSGSDHHLAETLAAEGPTGRSCMGDTVNESAPPLPRERAADAVERIGRYLVVGTLGEGGMGVVYAAYDPELDRKVAIKVLAAGSARARARERLVREAQALARLSHPNIVSVYDVGTHEGRVFVAMEFIAGETLSARLARGGHDLKATLRLFRAAGEGLAAAHQAGLVHRDFKPNSVLRPSLPPLRPRNAADSTIWG